MKEISFPVFKIGATAIIKVKDTIKYTYNEYLLADGITLRQNVAILDDTAIDKPTLGLRRLVLKAQGVPLVRLSRAIYFISDIVAKPSALYIDSNGKLFRYKRTKRVPLVFKKIVKMLPNQSGLGSIVEVENIPSRFKTLVHASKVYKYAGLLEALGGYILYGLYTEKHDNTVRKI